MHHKQNNRESKTFVQGLRLLGNTLPRGVKGILKKNGYNYSEIISKWSMLVGKNISSCSYPKSIKMPSGSKNCILIVSVKRGDEINIEYSKNEIVNKINSYFGYKLINEIKLETFSSEKVKKKNNNFLGKISKNYEKKINEIKNEKIKNSLSQLLDAIKND
tara:strand:+ start:3099 stop:3581 length:483 start_codon:yes stop_codon:yes gene_type:complete